MSDFRIEDNYELYDVILSKSEITISNLIREIKENEKIVPRIHRSIVWNKKKVKYLIVSLFKGIPIGEITMWRLHKKNPNIQQYRTIFHTLKQLPDWVNLILDGLQRCSAISAVFSKDDEIKELDNSWINLKETYNSMRDNSNLKESFTKEFKLILAELDGEDYIKTSKRIERIFGLVNRKLKISTYVGDNSNLAFDLLINRNKVNSRRLRI